MATLACMEFYESVAHLEWWANRSTCLGRFELWVRITAESGGRRAVGAATAPWSDEDREGFDFLMALEPLFTLRFPDDSAVLVTVAAPYEIDRLGLTEFRAA